MAGLVSLEIEITNPYIEKSKDTKYTYFAFNCAT